MINGERPPIDEFQRGMIAIVRRAAGEEYCRRLDESREAFHRVWESMSAGQAARWILDMEPHPHESP
jgi:hypothetical protein